MYDQNKIVNHFSFISGNSNSTEQIRNFPWEKSSLGSVQTWSPVLKTVLSTMLKVDIPMCLFWGKDQIQFGNDAFLKLSDGDFSIGDKGNFDFTAQIKQGNSISIPFTRINEHPIFNFSLIYAENGTDTNILGIYENSANFERESSIAQLIEQSPIAIAVLKGKEYVFDLANKQYHALIGRQESIVGKKLFDVLPELVGQQIEELLEGVMHTGIPYIGEEFEFEIFKRNKKEKVYVNFVYSPFRENNLITGILVMAVEVTNLVKSKYQLAENENKLRLMIMQSPIPVTIFRGTDLIIEMANPAMHEQIWRRSAEAVIGRKLLEVFPELKGQKYPELLQNVFKSGKNHREKESAANVTGDDGDKTFFVDYEYAPLFDDNQEVSGIMVTVNDVTERVLNRRAIEESENRLKIAIEASEIGTFNWNADLSDFIYSARMAQIFGHENPKGLNYTDLRDQIHPEDIEIRRIAHERSSVTGKLFYEVRIIKPDKTICWIRTNGQVFFDKNGARERIYGTVLDITAYKTHTDQLEDLVQKRTEEIRNRDQELKHSEDRYHKMTDEVQDYAIIMLSKDGEIIKWNQGAEKIKGYTENEAIGKYFSLFYLQEDRDNQVPEKLLEEARTLGRASQEGWRIRKDKSVFWASIVITALHDEDSNLTGFFKVTRDLTERKIAEDQMKRYTAELEFQNKELEQFAYIASHDLQEPLRKIQTFSGMLENNLDNKETAAVFVDKIKKSARRMTDLIKAVLNYSKLSPSAIAKENVNLNEIIEQVKFDFELMISEKNAEIITDDLPVIQGIPLQMSQLLSNLFSNSLKFTEYEPKIKITSRILTIKEVISDPNLKVGLTYAEIVFADNGIGFESQYVSQIFNMFQRLHDKQTYGGTGIGLALCKRIVENHEGHISAFGEPGEGARFHVYLPV